MKHNKLLITLLVILGISTFMSVSCSGNTAISNGVQGEEWVALSPDAQKHIITTYLSALDSFALAMPHVGGDTESAWAADTVHAMALSVKDGNKRYVDNMADIYLMYSYIAYGMSYFNAIIGINGEMAELSQLVLRDMLPEADSLHNSLINNETKDVVNFCDYAFYSTMNMQLFCILNAFNNNNSETGLDEMYYTLDCVDLVDSIGKVEKFTDRDVFKVSCILESSAFFRMIVPLMCIFDNTSGLVEENNSLIMEAAAFFDKYSVPINDFSKKGSDIIIPDDKDFEEYMLKANEYKVALLRIATKEMLAIK